MYTALDEFLYFSVLPAELRIQVWLLSFQQRRLVEVRTSDFPANIEYLINSQGNKVSDVRWVTKCPPPAALSVCREARHLALKFWTLRFALLAGGEEVIYINPVLDTIYVNLRYVEFLPVLLRDIQSFDSTGRGVQLLALATGFIGSNQLAILGRNISRLQGLSMLTLVIERKPRGPYDRPDEWEQGGILVAPETHEELVSWEKTTRSARESLLETTQGRLINADVRVVAIRRGEAASCLRDEEENITLEGPLRRRTDFDYTSATISWHS